MSKELYKRESFTVPTCNPGTSQEEWDAIFLNKKIVMRRGCPKCGKPGYRRQGPHFEHEKRCSDCNVTWEIEVNIFGQEITV